MLVPCTVMSVDRGPPPSPRPPSPQIALLDFLLHLMDTAAAVAAAAAAAPDKHKTGQQSQVCLW